MFSIRWLSRGLFEFCGRESHQKHFLWSSKCDTIQYRSYERMKGFILSLLPIASLFNINAHGIRLAFAAKFHGKSLKITLTTLRKLRGNICTWRHRTRLTQHNKWAVCVLVEDKMFMELIVMNCHWGGSRQLSLGEKTNHKQYPEIQF